MAATYLLSERSPSLATQYLSRDTSNYTPGLGTEAITGRNSIPGMRFQEFDLASMYFPCFKCD